MASQSALHRWLVVFGFVAVGALPQSAFAQPAPVEVDVLLSLTGSAGFSGQEIKKTVDLFEANVNAHGGIAGRPLKFLVHDDQTSTQLDVQLINDSISHKRAVVIGPMLSGLCSAVAPLASAGPLTYCLSPSISPPPGSYVFSNGPQQADFIATMLRYFRDRGIKRIAAITTTDGTGQDADKALAARFGDADNQRVGLERVLTPPHIWTAR
jgi:branched-chain amino acid transport system substrate-binding protein